MSRVTDRPRFRRDRACGVGALWLGAVVFAGWSLRAPVVVAREAQQVLCPVGPVESLAWSADGRSLASAAILNRQRYSDREGTAGPRRESVVQLWETGPGGASLRHTCSGEATIVASLRFLPDGRTIAEGSRRGARFWDRETGRLTKSVRWAHGGLHPLALSPDGTGAIAGSPLGVRVWDTATGAEHPGLDTLSGAPTPCITATYSADGRWIAGGGVGTLSLWSVAEGRRAWRLDTSDGLIRSLAFSPDGSLLAVGDSAAQVTLRNVRTGAAQHTFRLDDGIARALAFSPDGTRLAVGTAGADFLHERGSAMIWDARTGHPLRRYETAAQAPVTSLAYAPDGKQLAAGSTDATIRIWAAE